MRAAAQAFERTHTHVSIRIKHMVRYVIANAYLSASARPEVVSYTVTRSTPSIADDAGRSKEMGEERDNDLYIEDRTRSRFDSVTRNKASAAAHNHGGTYVWTFGLVCRACADVTENIIFFMVSKLWYPAEDEVGII